MMSSRLVLFGVAAVVVGMALFVAGTATEGGASTGGFILIGPVPIVFGTGPSGSVLALLAVIVGVMTVVVLAYYIGHRPWLEEDEETHK